MFDLVILGGSVVDGTGEASSVADVGIAGERIEAIGDLSGATARRVVDAVGMAVSPGFVDTHTHSEGDLLVDPQHAYGLRQGITTELLGIDGMSYAPLSPANYRAYRHYLSGLLAEPPEDLDMSSVAAFRGHYHRKVAVNTAYLVPHGAVRLEVVGFRDVPLGVDDLTRAKRIIREGIEQGAVGFSTSSSYYPGPWADTAEIVELCRAVRESGAVYMCEPRKANLDRAHAGSGILEALEVARRTGVRLHLAHYRTAPETAGLTADLMRDIDAAKSEGVDCSLDIYPYPTGSSIPVSRLPSDVQDGGPDAIMRRLGDPVERARIAGYLDAGESGPLEEVVFSYLPRNGDLEGMSLPDVARRRGTSMGEALSDLLFEEDLQVGYVGTTPHSVALWDQVSRDVMELLARPDYNVCSDITPLGAFPHPRSYGAFPRVLGRLRRQFGNLSLEETVHRMTARPASRFGLTDRGRIQKGYFADLVVFDPDRVIDNATFDDPRRYPTGIPYVVVNGQVAVDNERCTGVLAGQAVP